MKKLIILLLLCSCTKIEYRSTSPDFRYAWYHDYEVEIIEVSGCGEQCLIEMDGSLIWDYEEGHSFPDRVWTYDIPDSLKHVGRYFECQYREPRDGEKRQCGAGKERYQVKLKSIIPT